MRKSSIYPQRLCAVGHPVYPRWIMQEGTRSVNQPLAQGVETPRRTLRATNFYYPSKNSRSVRDSDVANHSSIARTLSFICNYLYRNIYSNRETFDLPAMKISFGNKIKKKKVNNILWRISPREGNNEFLSK